MTPTPDLQAIRQRLDDCYPLGRNEVAALLTLWDTQQTALRTLVEQWDARIGALEETIIALKRGGIRIKEAESLRSSKRLMEEMRAELARLLTGEQS